MANLKHPPARSRATTGSFVAPAGAFGVTGVFGALGSVGDPDGTRAVSSIVALLVALGIGLLMLAVWLFRVTRPDPEVLGPLEVMGERKWRRADPVWQRRRLDEVRPPGAEPLEPSTAPPAVDEAFDLGPAVSGFDDLQDARAVADDSIPGDPLVARATNHASPADSTTPVRRNGSVRVGPLVTPATDASAADSEATEPSAAGDGVDPGEPVPSVDPQPAAVAASAPGPIDPLLPAAAEHEAAVTPTGIERPTPDDLPDHEIDPALIAAAMAELDAELSQRSPSQRDDDGR